MTAPVNIALAGNPNAGKTTLFNTLTGSRQHVGNYPGVTVEKKEGFCNHQDHELRIIDLPGTYSLTAYSTEELVARDFLVNEKPDVVINIVDASNLERNLYLTTQFMELGVPLVIALNMMDVAERRGIKIDIQKLSDLLNVSVIPIIARTGKGVDKLLNAVLAVGVENQPGIPLHLSYGEDIDQTIKDIVPLIRKNKLLTETYPDRWTALKLIENDEQILYKTGEAGPGLIDDLLTRTNSLIDHLRVTLDVFPESIIADHRYGFIKSILRQGIITFEIDSNRLYASDKIDKIVTHRFIGPLIMAAILFALYTFTFKYSELPVNWLETFFSMLASGFDKIIEDGPLKSMIIAGVIDGVGGVLGFVPIIMFMFFGIAVLEDSGYLARVAFMMDRIFRIFGLHGSSVMPFIISGGIAGGCAVPGVLATRTLRSYKERMATLLTVPFMNCGAKLPVIALIISAFFSNNKAYYMFLATIASWTTALLAAKFLRVTVLRGESTPFVMELPPYRFPTFKGLLIHTWERTWQYVKKAGTVILGISILLWAMMTYPSLPKDRIGFFENQRLDIINKSSIQNINQFAKNNMGEKHKELIKIDKMQAEEALRYSIAGRIGTGLEKVSRFAGFDWRTNIALIGGFAAKEVIISTLGTAYSLGSVDTDDVNTLKQRLAKDPNWNPTVALAVLAFIMFYAPCFVTVTCIARESGSWKWAFFSIAFNTLFASIFAVAIYQGGMILTTLLN